MLQYQSCSRFVAYQYLRYYILHMCKENCTKAELYPINRFDVDDGYGNLDSQSLTN